MRVTGIPVVVGALGTVPKGVEKEPEGIGNQRKDQDHPNYRVVKISLNTQKCSGDLRRLAVTQTPVKDLQLTQVWKAKKKT